MRFTSQTTSCASGLSGIDISPRPRYLHMPPFPGTCGPTTSLRSRLPIFPIAIDLLESVSRCRGQDVEAGHHFKRWGSNSITRVGVDLWHRVQRVRRTRSLSSSSLRDGSLRTSLQPGGRGSRRRRRLRLACSHDASVGSRFRGKICRLFAAYFFGAIGNARHASTRKPRSAHLRDTHGHLKTELRVTGGNRDLTGERAARMGGGPSSNATYAELIDQLEVSPVGPGDFRSSSIVESVGRWAARDES
jgi:hypothetical protein